MGNCVAGADARAPSNEGDAAGAKHKGGRDRDVTQAVLPADEFIKQRGADADLLKLKAFYDGFREEGVPLLCGVTMHQISLDMLDQHWKPPPGAPRISQPVESIDFFVSHSWQDNARDKFKTLRRVAGDFYKIYSRDAIFWIDKFCIDQYNLDSALRLLPFNVYASRQFLVLWGSTYRERLWCLFEMNHRNQMDPLFSNTAEFESLHIYPLSEAAVDDPVSVAAAKCTFDKDRAAIIEKIEKDQGLANFDASVTSMVRFHAGLQDASRFLDGAESENNEDFRTRAAALKRLTFESFAGSKRVGQDVPDGPRRFADAMSLLVHLEWLSLANNSIEPDGSLLIAKRLHVLKRLRVFRYWGNRVGDEAAVAFADSIRRLEHLEDVGFTGCEIGDVGMRTLADALAVKTHLKQAWIQQTDPIVLSDDTLTYVRQHLRHLGRHRLIV